MEHEMGGQMITYTYHNETHTQINPTNREELEKAFTVVRELQELIDAEEKPDTKVALGQYQTEQVEMIRDYVDQLGALDTNLLQRNIVYLAKQQGIRMASLETFLRISPGYISRTLNGNSGKRMTLDLAWKIAQLLHTDLGTMLREDLQMRYGNTELVVSFLDKLTEQTLKGKVQWQVMGGDTGFDDSMLFDSGVLEKIKGTAHYRLARDVVPIDYPLTGDIMRLSKFIGGKEDLYLIPYRAENNDQTLYDFLILDHYDPARMSSSQILQWRQLFYNDETLVSAVHAASERLYKAINDMRLEIKIAPEDRSFIENYLTANE